MGELILDNNEILSIKYNIFNQNLYGTCTVN